LVIKKPTANITTYYTVQVISDGNTIQSSKTNQRILSAMRKKWVYGLIQLHPEPLATKTKSPTKIISSTSCSYKFFAPQMQYLLNTSLVHVT